MLRDETVSIVLATYNGEKFLKDQLDSLVNQALLPYEVLVCDDNSTDNTLNILEEFSKISQVRFVILKNASNLGPTQNFLKLTKMARGKFIALCDQDDYWAPEKLRMCIDEMYSSGSWMVGHSVRLIDENSKDIGLWNQGISFKNGTYFRNDPWRNFLGMSMVMDRRLVDLFDSRAAARLIAPTSGINGLSHDQWFDFIADSAGTVQALKSPLVLYRLHTKNFSGANADLAKRSVQLKIDVGFAPRPERKLALAARQRSELLALLAAGLERQLQAKLLTSSEKWRKLAYFEERRTKIFTEKNFLKRVAVFFLLLRAGAYRGWSNAGVGSLVGLKDFAFCFFKM
jgi:glycosyltransferase involved in cell wall biosynthesis